MVTIKYFDGKKAIGAEVTEEFAEAYKELLREEWRSDKRAKRLQAGITLDQMEDENGEQFEALTTADPLDLMSGREEQTERRAKMKGVLKSLTTGQAKLVKMLKSGMNTAEIAKILGKDYSSVRDMRERIQKKFEKFL